MQFLSQFWDASIEFTTVLFPIVSLEIAHGLP